MRLTAPHKETSMREMRFQSLETCIYCDAEMWQRGVITKREFRKIHGLRHADRGASQFVWTRRQTKEHLKRKADGGDSHPHNIAPACRFCNHSRGDASVEDHRAAIQKLIASGKHPGWKWLLVPAP